MAAAFARHVMTVSPDDPPELHDEFAGHLDAQLAALAMPLRTNVVGGSKVKPTHGYFAAMDDFVSDAAIDEQLLRSAALDTFDQAGLDDVISRYRSKGETVVVVLPTEQAITLATRLLTHRPQLRCRLMVVDDGLKGA